MAFWPVDGSNAPAAAFQPFLKTQEEDQEAVRDDVWRTHRYLTLSLHVFF